MINKKSGDADKTPIYPIDTSLCYFHSVAPYEEKDPEQYFINYSKFYSSVCFSTYPIMNGAKFGKPIADCTQIDVYKNLAIMSMADGCGMGSRPTRSAHVACTKFAEYVASETPKEKTVAKVLKIMIEAMAYVQTEILNTQTMSIDAGLTTFQSVVVLKVDKKTYAVCYVNVGDCRGLIINRQNEKIDELVPDYLTRVDVKTTGGRLGPVDGDNPELDNFRCGVQFVPNGSAIAIMTDGVCDNFDMSLFYESPKDCGCNGKTWSDDDTQQINKRKEHFYSRIIELYLEPSLMNLCQNIYDYVVDKTKEQRSIKMIEAAEKPKGKSGKNVFMRGKMDHSTFSVMVLVEGLFQPTTIKQQTLELPEDLKG
ncbi:PPM-type phosphatase domain-containing protein [Entamoeba marina]